MKTTMTKKEWIPIALACMVPLFLAFEQGRAFGVRETEREYQAIVAAHSDQSDPRPTPVNWKNDGEWTDLEAPCGNNSWYCLERICRFHHGGPWDPDWCDRQVVRGITVSW